MEILRILQLDTVDVRTFPFLAKKAKLLVSFIRSTMGPLWEEKGKQREKKKRLDRFRNWNIEFRKIEIFKRNNHKGRAVRPGNVEILRWLFPGKESE